MFPGGKADYSPPSAAKVKNAWRYASTVHAMHGIGLNYAPF